MPDSDQQRQRGYLLDPIRLPRIEPFGSILADPAIEKRCSTRRNDILTLKRDFGFTFASIFDTMLAARILGWPQVGLAAVLERHFSVKLDKRPADRLGPASLHRYS